MGTPQISDKGEKEKKKAIHSSLCDNFELIYLKTLFQNF